MVIAKFKTFGVFAIIMNILIIVCCCFFIYVLTAIVFLGRHFIKVDLSPFGALGFITFFLIMIILIIYSFARYAYLITINKKEQIITFKNIFSWRIKEYKFNDFDGFIDTIAYNSKSGEQFKVIYLIKDKKMEKIITGFYYANIDELQKALQPMKYFGFDKNYSKLARRAILKKCILD